MAIKTVLKVAGIATLLWALISIVGTLMISASPISYQYQDTAFVVQHLFNPLGNAYGLYVAISYYTALIVIGSVCIFVSYRIKG